VLILLNGIGFVGVFSVSFFYGLVGVFSVSFFYGFVGVFYDDDSFLFY